MRMNTCTKEESCRHTPPRYAIILSISLAVFAAIALSDSPPSNTIPIIAERPNFVAIDIDLFCMLSWMYFDGVQSGDYGAQAVYDKMVEPANQTGMYICIAPTPIQKWGHYSWGWVARLSENSYSSSTAYGRPAWYGVEDPVKEITYTEDTITVYFYASEFADSLEAAAAYMEHLFGDEECVWFYNTFDEAPARQWNHMVSDSYYVAGGPNVFCHVDGYIPNMYTQARDSVWHELAADSLWLPTLEEVENTGTFSWLKHHFETVDSTRPVVSVFSILHSIDLWAGMTNYLPERFEIPGTFHDQANAVRSYLNMEYKEGTSRPEANYPEYFLVDVYPFRHVGTQWLQDESTYVHTVSDSLDAWLLNHFSEGLDSTFIPVRQTALEQERDIPVFYYPQAFGRVGGDEMWDEEHLELEYGSYPYRVPTPAEFLMNCNIALLRGAKCLVPYCMLTFPNLAGSDTVSINAGHLDQNNLPFDAPYEDWVYTDRVRSDFLMIPPDLFPPFMDSPDDFDPLWDLPSKPTTTGDQEEEDYLLWKFAAYGRLWNSMRGTFAQIATIAPELAALNWWDGYEDVPEITSDNTPRGFVNPEIKAFTNSEEEMAYLFYVNRWCYDEAWEFLIAVDEGEMPVMSVSGYLLDHSRRFIIPVDSREEITEYYDTLDAGQARLVEFIYLPVSADLRITRPDVTAASYGSGSINNHDFRFMAGTDIIIDATVYNMGTQSASNVDVTLTDISDTPCILDTDRVSFSGLNYSTGYTTDEETAILTWDEEYITPGVHLLHIQVETLTGENDTDDNDITLVFQILPEDYATFVLDDPWDMDDDSSPDWNTEDITSLTGWSATFTDSIGGMFEGTIPNPSSTNKLTLNTGSGFSEWINTTVYRNFSLVAKADVALEIEVHWLDEHSQEQYVELPEDSRITTTWSVIGPVDLSTITSSTWDDEGATAFWLEFSGSNMTTDVRIGWIKLTE